MESVLLVDFWVVVERTKDDFVVLCKLLYLIECPQFITFFKREWDAWQENKNLHLVGIREQR